MNQDGEMSSYFVLINVLRMEYEKLFVVVLPF